MERLTKYVNERTPAIDTSKLQFHFVAGVMIGGDIAERLAAYEDTGMPPECVKDMVETVPKLHAKLAEYKWGSSRDLVKILPCKVGDLVWGIRTRGAYKDGTRVHSKPVQLPVQQMYFGDDMRLCIVLKGCCRGEWGKVVFGTEEDAWAAIYGGKQDG